MEAFWHMVQVALDNSKGLDNYAVQYGQNIVKRPKNCGKIMKSAKKVGRNLNHVHNLSGSMPMVAQFSDSPGDSIRDESLRNFVTPDQQRKESSIDFISMGVTFSRPISELSGISKHKIVNHRFQELPEPYIHTDGLG